MSSSVNPADTVELSLEELAAELGIRPRFCSHLIERQKVTVTPAGDKFLIDAAYLAETKENNRILRAELAEALADPAAVRRRAIAELAGVDEETARRLGY